MSTNARISLSVVSFPLLLVAAFFLASRGTYGWTLFMVLPVIAGALGTWSLQAKTFGKAATIGAAVGASGCALFLLLGREGFVCVLMALPIVVPLSTIGGLLEHYFRCLSKPRSPVAMCLLIPASLLFDVNARPPIYSVTTSMEMNASPEQVWKYVAALPDITPQPDWVLSSGVAYPVRTRISGYGAGAPRNCDLSTGTLDEVVVVWDKPHLLRFRVTSTPPAMQERGLYGPVNPKHLNGYYVAKEGQFELTPLPGGRTLVTGTSWYQHGLWPAEYWRCWSDLVVHHVHQRVLEHIRTLAESQH